MADWQFLAYRLNGNGTETLLDPELPVSNVGITKAISGPGGLTAVISPEVGRLVQGDGQPLLKTYSTAIYADNGNGSPLGGIVTNVGKSGAELSLTCTGFSSFPKNEPYSDEKFFVEVDPLDVYRHVWTWLQSKPRRNLGVVLGSTKTGIKIGKELSQVEFDTQEGPVSFEAGPVKLNWWDTGDLGGFLDGLAEEHKFDYVERNEWSSDGKTVKHFIDFGVPRIGRRRADLRFVVGENVSTPPASTYSGESYASEVMVLGAGEGRVMIRGGASREGETRLGRMRVVEDKQIKSVTAANARARSELAMLQGRPEITDITIQALPGYPEIGSWREGDDIELHTDGEWGDESDWYRVLSTTIAPQEQSQARLSVVRADMIPA